MTINTKAHFVFFLNPGHWNKHSLFRLVLDIFLVMKMVSNQHYSMGVMHSVLSLLFCVQFGLSFSVAGHENTCDANGSVYYVGEWYFLESDHCTQCECTTEGSSCARTECTSLPAACIHVSHYPTDCCPRCEKIGCEYRGVVYELGQNFQPNECEQCTCDSDGIARCLVADCAPPPCVNPIYTKGKCCPECPEGPNCYVDSTRSQVIPGGEPLWVDSCTKCRCHDSGDAGYWEGNRLAICSRVRNCTSGETSQKN